MRHKRGDLRSDGWVFWQYKSGSREYWLSPDHYAKRQAHEKAKMAALRLPEHRPLKNGDTREDGMVFWAYSKCAKNGEHWITREHYVKKREANAARMAKRWREYHNPEQKSAYRKANRAAINEKIGVRYHSDPDHRLRVNVRNRLKHFLKATGRKKAKKTQDVVGCSVSHLRAFIDAQLLPGMTWAERGLWHIDHFLPLSSARTTEDVEMLSHWTNLRPIWAGENMRKHDSIPSHTEIAFREEWVSAWCLARLETPLGSRPSPGSEDTSASHQRRSY